MDQIFSHVADQIALSGPSGTLLTPAIASVIPSPRPSLINYLRQQFEQQGPLFTITPKEPDVLIIAHPNLRRRALGFSPIENSPLPQPAWTLLEAIGRAGPSGLLQSSLGSLIGLHASMVHHYIGLLSARRLIGRRKTICHRSPGSDTPVSVTYTSVIVLARYAAQMLEPLSQADTASDARLQRLLNTLRQPPYIRAERDLKIIAIPDSERPSTLTRELFQRRRHRNYRALRTKLIRLGVVTLTKRKCVTQNGRILGTQPCLRLLERATHKFDSAGKARKISHPLLASGGDRFVAEVDIVEQVYRMLVEAGPLGISVPELNQYLDSRNVTSAPSKRIRTIINAISKVQPTVERQYFEGSAMYHRISLHGDSNTTEKRRKIGMTALGERRQEIVMELLQERRVLILETLGREVARVEDGAVARVDPKVMRRLISDLVAQKRVKLITTARPTIKDNPRSQNLVLVALPDVDERGKTVRNIVTAVVNRSLYGLQDDSRDAAKREQKRDMKVSGKVRKRIPFRKEDDEDLEGIPHDGRDTAADGKNEEQEDEEPVIVYQAVDADGIYDDEESADENCVERDESETKHGQLRASKAQDAASSRIEQVYNSSRQKVRQREQSLTLGKKKVSLAEEEEKRTNKEEAEKSLSRKRKRVALGDKTATKRSKATKKAGDRRKQNVKPKKQDNGTSDHSPTEDQKPKEDDDSAILIKSQPRNLKGSRIIRLRAVDYGCLKGKLARVRRFHKNLYEIIKARNEDDTQPTPEVEHITVESARDASVLGRFSFLSVLKEMTVGEYAATVGIYMDHGDSIKGIEREKIIHVLDEMNKEIVSNTASRQVQQLVQTMTKLELIQSDADSQWQLTGAGIIRDFGKGLPSGVIPHGIIFSSFKAVEEYWLELEQFSRCRMSRKPTTIDLRNEENVKHVETHPVGDLYFPRRWATGVHRLQKQEQLKYELILQRLSGVQLSLENRTRLRTDNFIKGKLRRFGVEELDKEMERVLKEMQKEGGKSQPFRKGMPTEELLLYSRFRTANPLPKWFLKNIAGSQAQDDQLPERDNDIVQDNSSLLQLTRTPSSIKGHQVRAAMPSVFDTNHRRYFKIRAKPKPGKELPPEGRADLKRLIPLMKVILRERAVAYHRNDADGLDWKVIPSLARYELQQSAADLKEAVEGENLRRTIVALCEITTVRAALDILSLKVVLRLHDLSLQMPSNDNRVPWSAIDVSKAAINVVNGWDSLDGVCSAIVGEVRDDIRHHAQVYIDADNGVILDNVDHRRMIVRKEFCLDRFLHGRPDSFAHSIEMMASRFRKVADIRLFREARYAILLSQPYGELTGDGVPEERAAIESGDNEDADDMHSKDKRQKKVKGCVTNLLDRVIKRPQDDFSIPDEGHSDGRQSLLCAEKSSALDTEKRKGLGTQENLSLQGKSAIATILPTESRAMQSMETFQTAITSNISARRLDPFSTHERSDLPYCPPELAELVVCAVVRLPPHAQWKVEGLKLLSQFRVEDLANARDRLILRGSISVHAEREKAYCCLQPCKNSRPAESMATLRGDTGGQEKWDEELRHAGDGCMEDTSLWRDLCSLELPSSFATAYTTSSTFFDSCGLSLVPKFEEDDDAAPVPHDEDEDEDEEDEDDVFTRIKLYFQFNRSESRRSQKRELVRRNNKTSQADMHEREYEVKRQAEDTTVMRQKVSHEIAESGRHGITLSTLLQRLNPYTDDEKLAIARALSALLQNGGIQRFAIETNDEEWEMTTGVFYICAVHCTAISAWRTPTGEVDQQLLDWVRDEVFECILRTPNCKSEELIRAVCARHTSVPRRAVADALFALEGELLTSTITIWRAGWQILRRSPSTFVDENAIVTWGKRCIQSFSGNAANFHRIENSQWRVRLSQLL